MTDLPQISESLQELLLQVLTELQDIASDDEILDELAIGIECETGYRPTVSAAMAHRFIEQHA